MALRPWHLAGLTAAGMALAVVVVLPPRPLPTPGEIGSSLYPSDLPWVTGAHYGATVRRTVSDLKVYARTARLADTLFAAATHPQALRSADRSLTLIYAAPLSADTARVWLGLLEKELALAPHGPGRGMSLIVRLRVAPRIKSTRPVRWSPDSWRSIRFVSPQHDRPACFVDAELPGPATRTGERAALIQRNERTDERRTRLLDWCMLYARFGAPGANMGKWAGRRAQVLYYWRYGPDLGWNLEVLRGGRAHDEMAAWWSDKLAGACSRSGGPCLRMVGLAKDPGAPWENYFTLQKASLLAALMLQDSARFERFWRSPMMPAAALEQAYGRPAGVIVAEFQRSIVRPEPGGPRIPAGALLSSLGWAVMAIGLGVLVGRRQQVR